MILFNNKQSVRDLMACKIRRSKEWMGLFDSLVESTMEVRLMQYLRCDFMCCHRLDSHELDEIKAL